MSYREQFIWKKSVDLAVKCYELTQHFPRSELYGLTNQIRRSAVSVASNIAEGYGRRTKNEYSATRKAEGRRQKAEGRI
ncbi:MAG: four helix bundle protein [Merismopedia sp. SIO2A8]|nr:four helix bundle protein [Merismopedia sp. SIO2A8]